MRVPHLALVAVLTLGALAACGDDGDDSSGEGTQEGFCAVADEIYSGELDQPEGGADAEDVVDLFRRLEDAAPPEIADETTTLREYIAIQFGVEEASDDSPTQAEITAANDLVLAYLRDQCGIVPPTTTTTPTTAPPA